MVPNHATDYISTHPFIYFDTEINPPFPKYEEGRGAVWHFPGVSPKGSVRGLRRSRIGNDVWLGENVIITNGANIGNGVIAGAGAVITKDVPDYAVVAGVPVRIIRYRYTGEEICALNRIAWWDWTDEQIRERYDDFFLDAGAFIRKYLKNSDCASV